MAQSFECRGLLALPLHERSLLPDRLAERIALAQNVDPQRGDCERARERDPDEPRDPARGEAACRAHAREVASDEIPGCRAPCGGAHAASATRSAARSRAD